MRRSILKITYPASFLSTDDDFYCYKHPFGNYELCQTCKNIKWDPDCNKAEECKCANIRFKINGICKYIYSFGK